MPVMSVAISNSCKRIVSGSGDETVRIWNSETGEELKTLSGHTSDVLSVSITDDDRMIISGSDDDTIKLWNLESGELIKTLTGHSDIVYSVSSIQIASGDSNPCDLGRNLDCAKKLYKYGKNTWKYWVNSCEKCRCC